MLAYILALAVGFGSLAIYMAAFFFPEVHRKSDFPWSGVGLFYALILWVCAGRITGAVLLGQIASVALLGWFGWQTLILRRELTPVARQTPIPDLDIAGKSTGFKGLGSIADLFSNKKDKTQKKTTTEGSTSPTVAKTGDYVASATVNGAVASPPDTVSTTDGIPQETMGNVANTSIPGDLVNNAADVISQEVTHPQEISQVELPTVSKEASTPIVTPTQPEDDGFDDLEDFAEITQEQRISPNPTEVKPKRSSAGFGGLLANLKNSLGNLGGFGKGKTKPEETTKEVKTSIPESEIPVPPTADIEETLESNLVDSVPEVLPETPISLTKTSDDRTTETTESMTFEVTEETVQSPSKVTEVILTENLTDAVDALETVDPTPPVEIAEMVPETLAKPLSLEKISEPKKAETSESLETLAEIPVVEVKELEKDAEEKLVKPKDSESV